MYELGIGEMAELNGISRKTLRFYQDKGLIAPVRIDEETGYRYYSVGQSFDIERIQQLQEMGASLSQIKEVLGSADPQTLVSLAEQLRDELDQEIDRLRLARYNASQIVKRNKRLSSMPILDTPILEHMAERYVLSIEIDDDLQAQEVSGRKGPDMEKWELALCKTKAKMRERGIPLSLFQNIGMSLSWDDFGQRDYRIGSILLFVQSEGLAREYGATTIPEGDFLTIYKNGYWGKQGNAEREGLDQLFEASEIRAFEIAGNCIEEVLVDIPSSSGLGRDALFKMQIPIKVRKGRRMQGGDVL